MPSIDAACMIGPAIARMMRHRGIGRIAAIVAAVIALNLAGAWIAAQLNLQIWPQHSDMIELVIVAMIIGYILAMATPFVPGIEIGLALMLLLGPGGIVLVYLCTQVALALSFLVGRLIPTQFILRLFGWLNFNRARHLIEVLDKTAPELRIQTLGAHFPTRWVSALLRHPYLAMAVILNLPGNALIGGAGGLGMIAGMSRVVPLRHFTTVMAIATLPVPLFLIFTSSL